MPCVDRPLRVELYALDSDPLQDRPYTVTEHQYEVTLVSDPIRPARRRPLTGPALVPPQPASRRLPAYLPALIDDWRDLPFFPHADR